MPSIALFIKQLLSEDKYSSDFSDKISERIKELNAAQLQGIYNHLVTTAKNAKSQTWSAANNELISKIEGVLKERVEEAKKIDKILEEEALKQMQRKRKAKEAKIEQKRVMKMIADTARRTAEAAVREEEQKRVAEEKMEIMTKVYQGEEKRNEQLKKIAVGFVIGIVVPCVATSEILFIAPCIFLVLVVTGIFVYKAQQLTVVVPKLVDEAELDMEIERREDVLKKKAISVLQEKERKFQEQQARDEQERKQRKALKKEQARFEAQLMANRRKEQLAKAQEVFTRRATTAGSMVNMSGRTTPVSARSSVNTFRPDTSQDTLSDYSRVQMPNIHDDAFPERPESGRGSQEGSENGEDAVVYGDAVKFDSEGDFDGSDESSNEEGGGGGVVGLRTGALLEDSDILDDSMVVHDVPDHAFADSEEEQEMKLFDQEHLPSGDEETGNGENGKKFSPRTGSSNGSRSSSSGKYQLNLPPSVAVLEEGALGKSESRKSTGRAGSGRGGGAGSSAGSSPLPRSARSGSGGEKRDTVMGGTASTEVSPRPALIASTPRGESGIERGASAVRVGSGGVGIGELSLDAQPKVEPDIEMGVLLVDIEQS